MVEHPCISANADVVLHGWIYLKTRRFAENIIIAQSVK